MNSASPPPRLQTGVQSTHGLLIFLNELNGCSNNDVVGKTFHNSLHSIWDVPPQRTDLRTLQDASTRLRHLFATVSKNTAVSILMV
jgi:hypothetical protein